MAAVFRACHLACWSDQARVPQHVPIIVYLGLGSDGLLTRFARRQPVVIAHSRPLAAVIGELPLVHGRSPRVDELLGQVVQIALANWHATRAILVRVAVSLRGLGEDLIALGHWVPLVVGFLR